MPLYHRNDRIKIVTKISRSTETKLQTFKVKVLLLLGHTALCTKSLVGYWDEIKSKYVGINTAPLMFYLI